MGWRFWLAVLLMLWSAAGSARHGSGILDPRRATPGIQVDLVEVESPSSPATPNYRLRPHGLPAGVAFEIWAKDFGQQFTPLLTGFRPDASGALVSSDASGKTVKLEDVVLNPGPYTRGAAWMVALTSEDHSLSAFAKVIPHPIMGRDKACAVSMELISLHGNRFVAFGSGFAPGEEVDIETRSSGRLLQHKASIGPDGSLPQDVVSHGAIGADFKARYQVKGKTCAPIVDYEWGDAAMVRR